jgi:hypothetical protein
VSARLAESRAGGVSAEIAIHFPPDCWLFLDEMRTSTRSPALPPDVDAVLQQTPRVELRAPIPEPRFVVSLSRAGAGQLQRWLQALLDGFAHDDPRRRTCLQCISRVAGAIRLSEL